MNGNHVRIIMGFSMLWCVNVICFFPDALAPWASTEWLRTYNTYALPAECLSLIATAILAFKTPRRIGMASVAIGYIELFCGLCAPAAETPALAGVLCGMGLAPTMMFWFALLTEFTERHQAIVQGWQALAGECLFLGASIFFDAGVIPACVLTATSAICALRVDSSSLFSESGGAGSSAKSFLSLGKTEWLAPCAGYLIASLAYGALIALSRGAEGEAASEVVSAIGAPIGALCFIAWAVTSRRRDYGAVSEWVVAASAVACLLSGSATVLLFSAFFQITGLLLFSLFIDRLSAMPRAAIACIASAYAISHLLFFFGLYLPSTLGAAGGNGVAIRELAWLACAVGATAFIARTWRTNASRNSEREYNIACELIAKKHGLTKRETEILSLLARGRDVSFICNELYLARNTVKEYTKRIYARLDIHSKQEAIDIVLSAISRP